MRILSLIAGLSTISFVAASDETPQSGGGSDLFNPTALLIVFREVIECCVVMSVVLNGLHKIGAESKKKWAWLGTFAGLFVSICLGIGFVAVFWVASREVFSESSEKVYSAVFAAIVCAMITHVALKMLKFSNLDAKWTAKLQQRGASMLQAALIAGDIEQSQSEEMRPEGIAGDIELTQSKGVSAEEMEEITGSNASIFLLLFSTVVREGLEVALFVGGIGGANNWRSIPLPAFVGLVAGLLVGLLMVYGGRKLENLAWFFYISCLLMLFIGAGFAAATASSAESIYKSDAHMSGSVIIGTPLWSIAGCCSERTSFFLLARGIVGYRDSPTFVMACVWLCYWIAVTALMWFKYVRGTLFDSKWVGRADPQLSPRDSVADAPAQRTIVLVFPSGPSFSEALVPQPLSLPPLPGLSTTSTSISSVDADTKMDKMSFVEVDGSLMDGQPTQAGHLDAKKSASRVVEGASRNAQMRGHVILAASHLLAWVLLIAVSCVVGLRAAKGVRLYYIAAEEVVWDFAPSGKNGVTGRAFDDPLESASAYFMVQTPQLPGARRTYKYRFVE